MKAFIISCVLLLAIVSAQAAREVDSPVSELPDSISAPAAILSLIADFESAKAGEPISVFLVNNSDHDLRLSAQDGDIFLKLETLTQDGSWQRAQPHSYSWCGNSYDFSPVVRKGHFMKIDGYQPKGGRKAKVRFRLYEQEGLDLVTQAGQGFVLDGDIMKASSDAMAISSGDFDLVASVARGEKKLVNKSDHITDLQGYAISTLGSSRFPADKVLPLLEELDSDLPGYKSQITYARAQISSRIKAEQDSAHQSTTRPEAKSE
jgi:hypothetical protein